MVMANPWPASILTTVHQAHTVTYRAQAADPGWAGAGGPTTPIDLQILDLTLDFDVDRTPFGKATLVVAKPAQGVRWLSPLRRTCQISIWVAYDGAERLIARMSLRRRALSWPGADVQLDLATGDADLRDQSRQLPVPRA